MFYVGYKMCACAVVRKLQEFESPFISLKSANSSGMHWITLHKT